MAEAEESESSTTENVLECAVCLQPCVHPARLPCGHIFCFLCVKGVANLSKRCAMCRREIPVDYLENPLLLEEVVTTENDTDDEVYHWFYEGRGGWWQYDERTNAEMEAAFKEEDKICELLIAGFLYVIDFRTMLQFRRNDPSRRRRIKRDLANVAKKGIAGIRLESTSNELDQDSHRVQHRTQNASGNESDQFSNNFAQEDQNLRTSGLFSSQGERESNSSRFNEEIDAHSELRSSELDSILVSGNELAVEFNNDENSDNDEWQLVDQMREIDINS